MRGETCLPNAYRRKVSVIAFAGEEIVANLGFNKCLTVPMTASKTNNADATTYAQPKNGFLPPIHETVEITTDFVPRYGFTGKSGTEMSK